MLWTNAGERIRGILEATIISPLAGCMVDGLKMTEGRGQRAEGREQRVEDG